MKKTLLEQLYEERKIALQKEEERQEMINNQVNDIEYETQFLFDYLCTLIKNDFMSNLNKSISTIDCYFYQNSPLIIDENGTIFLTYKVAGIKHNYQVVENKSGNEYRFFINRLKDLFYENGLTVTIKNSDEENKYLSKFQIIAILNNNIEADLPCSMKKDLKRIVKF